MASVAQSISWAELEMEFSVRESQRARHLANVGGAPVEDIDTFTGTDESTELRDRLVQQLADTWLTQQSWPHTAQLQAYYLYARCLSAWERSLDYRSIDGLIGVVSQAWDLVDRADSRRGPPCESERHAVRILIRHVASVRDCMAAEAALNSSCADELERTAGSVCADSITLLSELGPQRQDTFGSLVQHVLAVHTVYYGALETVAQAIRCATTSGHAATGQLRRTAVRLQELQCARPLRNDVYASELTAHRHVLLQLYDRVKSTSMPELTIHEARFVYVYPFALDGFDETGIAGRTARRLWGQHSGQNPSLAGEPPQAATTLHLTDIWSRAATRVDIGAYYSGVGVEMPPLRIETTGRRPDARDRHIEYGDYRVEIRLSDFGNHCVVIEGPSGAHTLHQVNQALRRASPWMGPEIVRGKRAVAWSGLAHYASTLVTSLAEELGNLACPNGCELARSAIRPIFDVEADFHVIVEIRSATVTTSSGPRVAPIDDLVDVAGPLLLRPIHRSAVALDEWVAYRRPHQPPNLFGDTRFECDFAHRTVNTTVLYMPMSPNWVFIGYTEMAQFAAATPALLRLWRHQLDSEHDNVQHSIERWTSPRRGRTGGKTASNPDSSALEHTRLGLTGFTARIRAQRVPLHSVELVQSVAHRVFLESLLCAAQIPRLDEELDTHVQRVDNLYERLITFQRVEQETRTSGFQDRVQRILAAVAVLSVAGVGSYLNDIWFSRDEDRLSMLESAGQCVGFLVVVLLLFVVLDRVWSMSRGPRRRRSPG